MRHYTGTARPTVHPSKGHSTRHSARGRLQAQVHAVLCYGASIVSRRLPREMSTFRTLGREGWDDQQVSWYIPHAYLANAYGRWGTRKARHASLECCHIREQATATRVHPTHTELIRLARLQFHLLQTGGRGPRLLHTRKHNKPSPSETETACNPSSQVLHSSTKVSYQGVR